MKLCKDCKYCVMYGNTLLSGEFKCIRNCKKTMDLVTGYDTWDDKKELDCRQERYDTKKTVKGDVISRCGSEGYFFEEIIK